MFDSFHIIAHDRLVQKKMDELGICWGVQYELARGKSRGLWEWSDVSPGKLENLRGTNASSAGKVSGVMKGSSVAHKESRVWCVPFSRLSYASCSLDFVQGGTRPRADIDH